MRLTPHRFALVAAAVVAVAGPVAAQFGFSPKAKIVSHSIGFRPAGGGDRDSGTAVAGVCKVGLWAPVQVAVEFQDVRDYKGGVVLEVTTIDCDELRTVTRAPIIDPSPYEPGTDEFLLDRGKTVRRERTENTHTAYVRLPSTTAEVRLRLVEEDNPDKALSDTEVITQTGVRASSKYVILSLGAGVPGLGFRRPDLGQAGDNSPYLRDGRVELARIDSVREMPDQWFGYEAADLVVLGTGRPDPTFIRELFTDNQFAHKRRALIEWVRRGGKLVLAVGDRAAEVGKSEDFAAVLPVDISPSGREESVWVGGFGLTQVGDQTGFLLKYPERTFGPDAKKMAVQLMGGLATGGLPDKLPPDRFPIAALKPNARKTPFVTLVRQSKEDKQGGRTPGPPLVVQAPLGLGRVTVVGFDLDRSPFVDEPNRTARIAFWEALVATAGDDLAAKPPVVERPQQQQPGQNWGGGGQVKSTPLITREAEDGAAAALRASVDHYDEVPVISFGWVALFILGYTLIIGPIEYILLKKLFGRLELTWITFPIIVLSVSGAAYLTAYAVKGKDLRMNKIDVVDIDLRTDPARPRVYGRTWFTIFSPRIDSYTVGVEPKGNWATQRDEKGYSPVTTVDWFGPPKQGGVGGGGSSRGYRYEIDPRGDLSPQANGVSGVPIQVWSTKAFVANWSGVADPTNPPATSTLTRSVGGSDITGTGDIRFNLSLAEVEQAFAVYRGEVYEIPDKTISPDIPLRFRTGGGGAFKRVPDGAFKNDPRFQLQEQDTDDDDQGGPFGRNRGRTPPKANTAAAAKDPLDLGGLLFHQHASRVGGLQNATLRALDQSWRLSKENDSEVILVFKLKRQKGQAETMMSDPDSPSPSRVWLHGLPGRDPKQTVDGIVQQDTYVRMYLPVKPPGAK